MATESITVYNDTESSSIALLEDLTTKTREYIENAKSSATRSAYARDWQDFAAWCSSHGLEPLPSAPETVCLYVTHAAKSNKVSTITRRLASISIAHQTARLETPTRSAAVRLTMQGIRRMNGTAQTEKAPVTVNVLRDMVDRAPNSIAGIRDCALLLVGFAGAFRRSELTGLNREDITFTANGLEIILRRSKTDTEGRGTKVAIPYGSKLSTCPVRSLQAWLDASGITSGPLFLGVNRHGQIGGRLDDSSVARIVKAYAEKCGLDASLFAGHSLRAGLATSAAAAGVQERTIQTQTRHKSVVMLRKYIREGDLWKSNAAAEVGL